MPSGSCGKVGVVHPCMPSSRLSEMGVEASVLCRVLKAGRQSALGGQSSECVWVWVPAL